MGTFSGSIQRLHIKNIDSLHLSQDFKSLETGRLVKVGGDGSGDCTGTDEIGFALDFCMCVCKSAHLSHHISYPASPLPLGFCEPTFELLNLLIARSGRWCGFSYTQRSVSYLTRSYTRASTRRVEPETCFRCRGRRRAHTSHHTGCEATSYHGGDGGSASSSNG